ncbi:MAG: GNAT family N-acetyltransferase [Promethearchaeota archaeon]|jgi:ribosomal protein S18 acetylase RimI-like enzyme
MKSKKDIKRFQEFLLNSWPAKNYYFLNGWILRFNDGITSRANSVFPVRYMGTQKTLDKDIDIVENAYKAYGLPPIFTMHDFHEPVNLKDKLLNRGYQSYDHTTALGLKIDEIEYKEINNNFEYIISNSRVKEISEFLARFSKWNEEDQFIIQKINKRIIIPKKCYMITKQGNKVIGTLLAVLIPQGYLYIGDVFVHPDYRRQDIATSMLNRLVDEWALLNGAESIWLQVEKNNNKALNLYCKIGMIEFYNYYYMKRE